MRGEVKTHETVLPGRKVSLKNGPVLIFGAGGHGKVVLDILLESGVRVAGFLDEDQKKSGHVVCGLKVVGGWDELNGKVSCRIALGIGNNEVRRRIFDKAKALGLEVVCAIHPKAVVSRNAKMGEGVIIMPGAVVNTGAILQEGVVVNTSASVDHDCILERFCQIWPGARLAGAIRVGEGSYVGTGASVIPGITIGRGVMIGAGAAVISDIGDGKTVVGVPAKPI